MRGYLVRPAKAAGKLPGVLVDPREPRAQPAHRGHRAAPRARQLHGLRARRAVPARRLSRRRGQGARAVREARSGQDPRGLRGRRQRAEEPGRTAPAGSARSASATAAAWSTCWRRALPDLAAAVPFYGNQRPRAEDVPKIKAPLLIHYAETDERINAGWPAFEEALKANNVRTRCTCIPARSTASTTTRRRATTRPPRSWRGSGRWSSSTSTLRT